MKCIGRGTARDHKGVAAARTSEAPRTTGADRSNTHDAVVLRTIPLRNSFHRSRYGWNTGAPCRQERNAFVFRTTPTRSGPRRTKSAMCAAAIMKAYPFWSHTHGAQGAAGGSTQCPLVLLQRGYPVGRRMERGGDCVERNRSERSKVASVAEWKPPASPEAQC